MDFPSYVPEGARQHALHYLSHWEPPLAEYDDKIAALKLRIKKDNNAIYHEELRQIEKEKNYLAHDVLTIRRLIHDARMKDAYKLLATAFSNDENQQEKIDSFIHGAWAAWADFSKCRERLKRANDLRNEIIKTADKLANLLDEIIDSGVRCPDEFSSIPALLSNTDNHDRNDYNLRMWRSMSKYILGDLPERELTDNQIQYDEPIEFEIVAYENSEHPVLSPEEQTRNNLHYAWGTSPYFSAMLRTVSKTAKEFKPSEDGFIGSAIKSRKRNTSTEYIRAFGALLNDYNVPLTRHQVIKAIAITATVVIDSSETIVSFDDVRKALAQIA